MPYNSKAFGIVVSRMRVQKNMTQEQLSGLTGIARSHLAALEGGQKNPGIETIWKLAEALSVKPSKLIQMTEKAMEEEKK